MITILSKANILNVRSGESLAGYSVIVEDNLIRDICHDSQIEKYRSGSNFIDLRGSWLLPGLIDVHVHASEEGDVDRFKKFKYDEHPVITGLRTARNLSACVDAGITLIRDVGTYAGRNIQVRAGIENGAFDGPRMLACGHLLTFPGGHFASRGREVKGVNNLRNAVKEEIEMGADFVKVINGPGGYDLEELRAIVDQAHKLGKKAACHTVFADTVTLAINAGFDTIEHASEFSEEQINQMIAHDIICVPTYVAAFDAVKDLEGSQVLEIFPDTTVNDFTEWFRLENENLPKAIRAGVKIATGTDTGFPLTPFNSVVREIVFLSKLGASNLTALQSSTLVAAEAVGKQNELGLIEPGKLADLICVPTNPLEDLNSLFDVRWVMINGKILRDRMA